MNNTLSHFLKVLLLLAVSLSTIIVCGIINLNLLLPALIACVYLNYQVFSNREIIYIRDFEFYLVKSLIAIIILLYSGYCCIASEYLKNESNFNKYLVFPILLIFAMKFQEQAVEWLKEMLNLKPLENEPVK